MAESKSIEVIMVEMNHLKEDVSEMKKTLKEDTAEIKWIVKEFIASADSKYATKDEHKANLERISRIDSLLWKMLWLIWTWVAAALWASVSKLIIK